MAQAIEETKAKARKEASINAVAELSKIYYTFCQKEPYIPIDTDELDKGDHQIVNTKTPITESNIGFKLLKSLGWSPGTPLRSDGLADPVNIPKSHTRAGFGSNDGTEGSELDVLKNQVENFAVQHSYYDLVLDKNLSKPMRHEIHQLATKLGLTNKSYNVRELNHCRLRQLVLSHKVDPFAVAELLLNGNLPEDHVVRRKYELIPPRTEEE